MIVNVTNLTKELKNYVVVQMPYCEAFVHTASVFNRAYSLAGATRGWVAGGLFNADIEWVAIKILQGYYNGYSQIIGAGLTDFPRVRCVDKDLIITIATIDPIITIRKALITTTMWAKNHSSIWKDRETIIKELLDYRNEYDSIIDIGSVELSIILNEQRYLLEYHKAYKLPFYAKEPRDPKEIINKIHRTFGTKFDVLKNKATILQPAIQSERENEEF